MKNQIATVTPIEKSSRIEIIDILRGFALIGVLVINVYIFNSPRRDCFAHLENVNAINKVTSYLLQFFVAGKFMGIFTFLFGLGFSIQIYRLKQRSKKYSLIYIKRLLILLIIGVIHSIVIWDGDILRIYAISGFFLLLFRNSSPKRVFRWMIALWIVLYLFYGLITFNKVRYSLNNQDDTLENTAPVSKTLQQWRIIYEYGSYFEVTKLRFEIFTSNNSLFTKAISPLMILPFFLLGTYFGRKEFISKLDSNIHIFKKLIYLGIPGIILEYFHVFTFNLFPSLNFEANESIQKFFEFLSKPFMVLFWISFIMLLYQKGKFKKFFKALQPVGQMALTNYLMQSIILTFVFYNYGLGLGNQLSILQLLLFSVCFFIMQIFFSKWWLKNYRFGPFEWIWRVLTYKKLEKNRIS